MKPFRVHIVGLSHKAHHFDYLLDDAFFKEYGNDIISQGKFQANVTLEKKETFIEASFKITGTAHLICDRSLKPFDEPMAINKRIVFKFGTEEAEISDEIVIISPDRDSLELGQYIYEFLVLAVPMKKLHPDFREAEEAEDDVNGKMVYTSEGDKSPDVVDPRWEILKKLK